MSVLIMLSVSCIMYHVCFGWFGWCWLVGLFVRLIFYCFLCSESLLLTRYDPLSKYLHRGFTSPPLPEKSIMSLNVLTQIRIKTLSSANSDERAAWSFKPTEKLIKLFQVSSSWVEFLFETIRVHRVDSRPIPQHDSCLSPLAKLAAAWQGPDYI